MRPSGLVASVGTGPEGPEPPHWIVFSQEVGKREWVARATGTSFLEAETELMAMKEEAVLMIGAPPVVWMIARSDRVPPGLVLQVPVSPAGEH